MSTNDKFNCEFYVVGMHCAACELLIERKFAKHPLVEKVDAVLAKGKVYLRLAEGTDPQSIRAELSALISADGYELVSDKADHNIAWAELGKAFGIAVLVFGLFLLVQKLGIIDLVNTDQINLPFIFMIGVVASISTCMAVVGGLVLSISGSYAREKQFKPLALFHISRIVSFFILGGVIGLLGSAFVLTQTTSFILNLFLFVVMLILGLNMLEIFPVLRKFQLKIPKMFGKKALALETTQNIFTPILLGAVTFILPCGFTQSMQLYSLTTGSFLNGAVTMFVFALGTFPVLALISFASVKLSQTLQSKLFYKTAGFIVLFFAVFNFLAALVAAGLIAPVLG